MVRTVTLVLCYDPSIQFHDTLSRFLASYAMLVGFGERAHVGLRIRQIGGLGFSVVARKNLPEGIYIYELTGMMAADGEAIHSRLSEITPYPSQRKVKGCQPRVLFGPARFINHDCNPNVEVCSSSWQFMYSDSTCGLVHVSERNICFCIENDKSY